MSMKDLLSDFENHSIIYNQYERYPSNVKDGWVSLNLSELYNRVLTESFIVVKCTNSAVLLEVVESNWDSSHFGFKVAKISNPLIINECNPISAKEAISQAISLCKKMDIKLVVSRTNGDNLNYIHALEDKGFKYFETIIWPIANIENTVSESLYQDKVTLFDPQNDDIEQVKYIAEKNQYQRGHYHCDERIAKKSVNSLYAKWVQSAFESNKMISLIKHEGTIAGYFICDIDEKLNKHLGFKYGRFQSLALDSNYRNKGLGKKLFQGTLSMLKSKGCSYVDSGYATKNHISSKLHSDNKFVSVYEEITMHYWL